MRKMEKVERSRRRRRRSKNRKEPAFIFSALVLATALGD